MIAPLRVLGLDLKPSRAGIARTHGSDGEPRLSVAGVGVALRPLHEQIDLIEFNVRRACDMKPDVVAIEGTFSRPGASDYGQHAVHFAITRLLWHRGIPYVDVAPATLKVWATGSGATHGENKVTKDKVCAAIVATYGSLLHINPRDDDACDAVALLSMTLAAYGQPLAAVPINRRRALNVVTWPKLKTGALT